jgi:hypothetical protein
MKFFKISALASVTFFVIFSLKENFYGHYFSFVCFIASFFSIFIIWHDKRRAKLSVNSYFIFILTVLGGAAILFFRWYHDNFFK